MIQTIIPIPIPMTKEEYREYLRAYAREYWQKKKDDPEYKAKRKQMHRKYYLEHREKELEYKANKRRQNENRVTYAQ